ncbi:MAG: J domain-containing protein [Bacteroidetes bacterium]|nr:J domain-containing protein [Bacteroidota bacterium]
MPIIDYYRLLGVQPNSSEAEIKDAYRKLSKKFHPDLNDGDNFFAERFKDITSAYETLIDSKKRANYHKVYNASKVNSANSGFKNSNTASHNAYSPKNESFKFGHPGKEGKSNRSRIFSYIIIPIVIAFAFVLFKGLTKSEKLGSAPRNTQEEYSSPQTETNTALYNKSNAQLGTQEPDTVSIKPAINNNAVGKSFENYPIGYYMVLASNDHYVYAHYRPDLSTKFDFHYAQRREVYIHKIENGFGYVDEGTQFNDHYWLPLSDLALVEKDEMSFSSIKGNEDYIINKLEKFTIEKTHYGDRASTGLSTASWTYKNYSFKFLDKYLIVTYTNYYSGFSKDTSIDEVKFPIEDFKFPASDFHGSQLMLSSINENIENKSSRGSDYSSSFFLDFRVNAETDLIKNLSKAFLKLRNSYKGNQ